MKKITSLLALTLLAPSLFAANATYDPALPAIGDTAVSVTVTPATSPDYIREEFTFSTSDGVGVATAETSAAFGVATGHGDGQFGFGGSTEGGAVAQCSPTKAAPGELTLPTPTALAGCGSS